MGLEKAIKYGKEHRKPFSKETGTYAKSVDSTCRNHGSCSYCLSNRMHSNRIRELNSREQLNEFNV